MLAISLSIAAGCSGPLFAPIGYWVGEADIQPSTEEYDEHALGTLRRVTLDVREDGTFELVQMGLARAGDISYFTDKIVLRVKTFVGKPIAEDKKSQHPDLTVRRKSEQELVLTDPSEMVGEAIILRKGKPIRY